MLDDVEEYVHLKALVSGTAIFTFSSAELLSGSI